MTEEDLNRESFHEPTREEAVAAADRLHAENKRLTTELTRVRDDLSTTVLAASLLAEELRRAGDNLPSHCTTTICDTCGRRLAVYATGGNDWTEEAPRLACATCAEGHGPGDELPIGAALKMLEFQLGSLEARRG